ncbi:chitin synthase [Colletotrichum truncatum]|uniref:Chitin synthase n=1 Tax=Colletotrichum truncatum TaxID=5467 RepID=A0ACC3ZDE7_COLTU
MEFIVQAKWVKSTSELRSCLGPKLDTCAKCQGHSKNKSSCGNPISQASRSQITSVLFDMVQSGSISCAAQHLEHLASLVLCKRYHQNQIAEKATEWRIRLRSFLGLNDILVKQENGHNEGSPTASLHKPKIKSEPTTDFATVVKEEDDGATVKLETITSSKESGLRVGEQIKAESKSAIHSFTPFHQTRPMSTINKEVIKKLQAPFMKSEMEDHTKREGYIYGYKMPEGHKLPDESSCRMIKIGFTDNLEKRMQEWQKRCQYEPQVVFSYKVFHHVKMERIIHLHLGNERRKETKCPGCEKNHIEFFDVDTPRAEAVVMMWAVWARLRPFDEEGRLSQCWAQKLNEMNTEDPDCWENFILNKVV